MTQPSLPLTFVNGTPFPVNLIAPGIGWTRSVTPETRPASTQPYQGPVLQ
jgi:hypothetical protein